MDLSPEQLNRIPLFAGLDVASLHKLVQVARWREYEAGEVVALEGDMPVGIYYLHFGWLKAVKVSSVGREQILRFLEPGDTFNEVGIFANQNNPVTVIALESAGVWILPRTALLQLLQDKPAFAQHLLARMAQRLLYLVTLVSDLSLRPVTGRLAQLLLTDAVDEVLERPRWYTQAELAARLGTVPDVVQRALRELENDGLIRVEREQIRILDRAGLTAVAA
jgi:CRP/FNR family transcriptional regulator